MYVDFDKAVSELLNGNPCVIPTETVYGLAAPIAIERAVEKVFQLKQRPANHPLIVHVASVEAGLNCFSAIPDHAIALANQLWPGPVTLLGHRNADIPLVVTGGKETVAIRMPNHPLALAIIEAVGPLAAPSANRYGRISPTDAAHIRDQFPETVGILAGEPCTIGLESTILDVTHQDKVVILRQGTLRAEAIADILKPFNVQLVNEANHTPSRQAPGTVKKHYAPRKPMFSFSTDGKTQALIQNYLEGMRYCVVGSTTALNNQEQAYRALLNNAKLTIALPDDFDHCSQVLYDRWHQADQNDAIDCIVMLTPESSNDLWAPINERIQKASYDGMALLTQTETA